MNNFLERYKLPKLTQEEIENFSRTVASKEIKLVIIIIIKLPTEKAQIASL